MEELLSPRTSLRTLSEARFAQDGTGALLLERTTLFAEAQCTLGDRRLRLFCPLSPLAHRLAETTAQRRKHHPAESLLPWRMLRGEFTYTDATGTQRTCDLVAQELPAEGEPLATAVGHADRDRLLSALDTLQRQFGAGRPDAQQPQSGQPLDDARLPAAAAALRLHAFRRRRRRTAVRRAARFRRRKGLRGTNDVRYLGGVQRTVHRFSEPPLGRTHVRTDGSASRTPKDTATSTRKTAISSPRNTAGPTISTKAAPRCRPPTGGVGAGLSTRRAVTSSNRTTKSSNTT